MKIIVFTLFFLFYNQINAQEVTYSKEDVKIVSNRLKEYVNSLKNDNIIDNCENAKLLRISDKSTCIELSTQKNLPSNHIGTNGATAKASWFRLNTGKSPNLVYSIKKITPNTNCGYYVAIYGPYKRGHGCLPNTSEMVYSQYFLDLTKPLFNFQIKRLFNNSDYIIQIINENCNSATPKKIEYNISVYSNAHIMN